MRKTRVTESSTRTTPKEQFQMVDFDTLPALISVPKAAEMLGISRASAYRFAAAEELPVRRLGGRVFVVTRQLQAFIDGPDRGEAAA
ncbi:MAG: helix-turn-helix domain-containing protein [Dermatophilaceae bacterium]